MRKSGVTLSLFIRVRSPTAKRPGWVELNGDDLRRDPATLASLLVKADPGIRVNEHLECDGDIVFRHACKMGLEGIVSKRKGSSYVPDALRTG